ncbi:MAG: YggT family protein [Pseudomonadota bacterium]
MRILMGIYQLGDALLSIYQYAIIASAILSWLIAFNVINTRNAFVYQITDFLYRVTEPALRQIRRFIPDLGGVDISPIILFLLIGFIARPVWAELILSVIAPLLQ